MLKLNFMISNIFSIRKVLVIGVSIVFISAIGFIFLQSEKAGCSSNTGFFFEKDTLRIQNPVYQVPIPKSITFAGEEVPIHLFDVRESLDRELQVNTYWHSQTVLLLKRANRYFPIIEPILKEMGVPDDFKYLAVAESSLTQAVSPSQAVGFWQILEGTGRELKLEINKEVDERYHIEKSTYAACDFLIKSFKTYGNWTMAAASYNFGRNGINRQIERQWNNDYYDMVLGEETGRYVFRILALKTIFETPEQYGFYMVTSDLYPPLKYFKVEIDTAVTSFAQFANHFNTSYKMLKFHNPWLRDSYLTNKNKKKYTIKIPEQGFRESAYRED
jgi:membrane-bound lytic murein transglycosylase D